MRNFNIIFYVLGVILCFIGFILYNFGITNDRSIIIGALSIGVGLAFLLGTYI